jgi:GNAT superfamily N-acetyltransferase
VLSIRPAVARDAALLRSLIHEFAEFERLEAAVTEAQLRRDGFGPQPKFRALLAEWSAKPAGYAIFYDCYASFDGRAGTFLEDIYVRAQFRGKGIGKALLARVAVITQQQRHGALRFQVLDWNRAAIDFYQSLGAILLEDWRAVTVKGDALAALAAQAR